MSQLSPQVVAALDGVSLCALRAAGKWILRGKRERYSQLGHLPLHRAHTVWPLDAFNANRALVGQLDAVPPLLYRWDSSIDSALVQTHLSRYLVSLLVSGRLYEVEAMRAAIEAKL